MSKILEVALGYLKQGIPAIPASQKTKAPLVKWVEFQKRLPTKEETVSMFSKFPGCMVAIVTGTISGIMVVDADSEYAIKRIEETLPETYDSIIAVSPRGGRHYYYKCSNPTLQTKAGILEKIDIRASGGIIITPPSRRDDGGHYEWLTCIDFNKESLQDIPEPLAMLLNINIYNLTRTGAPARSTQYSTGENVDNRKLFQPTHRDADLFELAKNLRKAGKNPEYILQVLERIAIGMGDDFGVEVLKEKIKSTFSYQIREEKSLAEEVRNWVLITTDNNSTFLITDVYRDLDLITRDNKMKAATYLSRLVEEGLIERYGEKRGSYRKVDKEIEYMDYVNAIPESVDLLMPFHLHDVAEITPKAIIVIAGATNSGKTAFFLNLIKMNMDKFNSFLYLNSETSPQTFRKRLDRFGEPISFWQDKLKVIDRCSNFADVIDPDGFNVIDYLELDPEKTFKVSEYIRNIFNKLNRGIAFIGLQKASKASFGRGGEFTLEKAQLAISMDYDKAKIVKCKSPKNGFAYHNSTIDFNISFGCNIVEKSGWKQE